LNLGALFSGGKDSTFAILKAQEAGHRIECLITLRPVSDESMLFHYPNNWLTSYQAEAMELPLIEHPIASQDVGVENHTLGSSIKQAVSLYGIEGIVHGGIASDFQRRAFDASCKTYGIKLISPLWQLEPHSYMNELLEKQFEIIIVSVSAMGLGRGWLGRKLDRAALQTLVKLSAKYKFNLNFEGGEAETLVSDCPLFKKRLVISKSRPRWDGQRGMFEILEAALVNKEE